MGEQNMIYGMNRKREGVIPMAFQNFVNKAEKSQYPRGDKYIIDNIDRVMGRDMRKKGLSLSSTSAVMTDNIVFKYKNHPKAQKGATLNKREYYKVYDIVRKPTHIYEDTKQKSLTYVFTKRYASGRVLKIIVHPNYKSKGYTYNFVKSIGVVAKEDMKGRQYRKIK